MQKKLVPTAGQIEVNRNARIGWEMGEKMGNATREVKSSFGFFCLCALRPCFACFFFANLLAYPSQFWGSLMHFNDLLHVFRSISKNFLVGSKMFQDPADDPQIHIFHLSPRPDIQKPRHLCPAPCGIFGLGRHLCGLRPSQFPWHQRPGGVTWKDHGSYGDVTTYNDV